MFDSHLHLTSDRFSGDLDQVLARAREAGVTGLVTVATDPRDGEDCLALARIHDDVWATAGVHPHDASAWAADTADALRDLLAEPEIVAVGEAGLDFHYDNSPRAAQLAAFETQLAIAAETDLPVVIHSRDADAEMTALIRAYGRAVSAVLHCFTGGDALLDAGLEAGWYVSFGGIVTFGSFAAHEQVRRVPRDRLLVETDAPYLAPAPMRGKRNEPAFILHTCRRIGEIRGASADEVAASTERNARDFYGLPAAPGGTDQP